MASNKQALGLYDPRHEHDACGVGFVAHIKGQARHDIIEQGLKILENLDHRGAVGADPLMGDGAGILLQIPDALYREEMLANGVSLPPLGEYGVGMVFLPQEHGSRQACIQELERTVRLEGQVVLGWRDVPVNEAIPMSPLVRATEPVIVQIFIGRGRDIMTTDALERKLYVIRKRASHAIRALALQHGREYFVPSMSARTVVYKGQLLADQVGAYYCDLQDKRTVSALAMVHQRFSTNTFPSWQLAHPYRMIAHNGEINTIKGNVNWINARAGGVASAVLGSDLSKLWPLTYPGQSDSACFDNCLELLVMAGYPLAQAMMMMIPEAWEQHTLMDENRRAFYEYHAAMMEPWDGPAAMIFTDGKQIGATLDRNGLRPARFYITRDDLVVMASEAGVLSFPQDHIVKKGRLRPGKMFLLDMEQGCIIDDKTLKDNLANAKPYKSWVEAVRIKLDQMIQRDDGAPLLVPERIALMTVRQQQQGFAYTRDDLHFLYTFIASAEKSVGLDEILRTYFPSAMALEDDAANAAQLAVLSPKHKLLFDYFRQLFAQVTNPPIDAIRENIVMSLVSFIGPKPNVLDINNINPPMRLEVSQPILNFTDIAKIREITHYTRGKFCSYKLDICYPVAWGKEGIEARLASLCAEAVDAVQSGYNILVISDRGVDATQVAIPVLLATSAIHQHLVKKGLRTCTGLVVETGAARTAHQFALLAAYGAEAIHPYLALETLIKMLEAAQATVLPAARDGVIDCYIQAIGQGLQQVMAQMGISAYMSYTGSQIFEAIGLAPYLVEKYFTGTVSSIGGIDIFEVAEEALQLHYAAFGQDLQQREPSVPVAPSLAAQNASVPEPIAAAAPLNLRSLFEFKSNPSAALSIAEVESAEKIIKRFILAAATAIDNKVFVQPSSAMRMSSTLAQAPTLELASTIASVCLTSDRGQVSAAHLACAEHIQIDMTPAIGHQNAIKESAPSIDIGTARLCPPALLSASPHHDVYSIEDLAQLIHDLKNINPQAVISIKLLSSAGIGTVAAGVAKAKADQIVIVAPEACTPPHNLLNMPLSISHPHRGVPWEIGLAEVQQTLMLNGLRGRVRIQLEAPLNQGRDIVMGALLGAELFSLPIAAAVESVANEGEYSSALTSAVSIQAAVIEEENIATNTKIIDKTDVVDKIEVIDKNTLLNKSNTVAKLDLYSLAEEVRGLMADFGVASFDKLIGCSGWLTAARNHSLWKSDCLDFSSIFYRAKLDSNTACYQLETQNHELEKALDYQIMVAVISAIEQQQAISLNYQISNAQRAVGAMLSGEVLRRYGPTGMNQDTVSINFNGTAGQSFAAFLAPGITLNLAGDANDYVGKGLAGGRVIVRLPEAFCGDAADNIIVGNSVLYGATSGEAFFNGIAGERFAASNRGAIAVVEGVGEHGCEYMTAGTVVVLGNIGRNFAAGMIGGVVYVYEEEEPLQRYCEAKVKTTFVLTVAEKAAVKTLIEQHALYTDSTRAHFILGNWSSLSQKFFKVVPNYGE